MFYASGRPLGLPALKPTSTRLLMPSIPTPSILLALVWVFVYLSPCSPCRGQKVTILVPKLILLHMLVGDQVATFCYHYEGYFRKTSLFTPSGGHNFPCTGRVRTGSSLYKPPLLYVPTHRVSTLGVESFKKRGGRNF